MNQSNEEHVTPSSIQGNNYIVLNGNNHNMNDEATNAPVITVPTANTNNSASMNSNSILNNFILMSILFSSNHGCVVACLSLATARLGSIGAYQSGLLYDSTFYNSLLTI
jgi:hypothetical protein